MTASNAPRRSARQFRQKRLLLVFAVLLGTGLAGYAAHRVQVNRQAPALLERGRAMAAAKDWKPAIDAFTQYLKLRPRDADAHFARAEANFGSARYKDALEGYLDALAHDPERTDARRKLAELHHAGRRAAATREQLVKLIGPTGKTTDPTLYLMLADCDFWDKQWEKNADKQSAGEMANLRAAVALPTAPPVASYRLADRLRTQEKTPQAIVEADAVMEKLVAGRPSDLDARLLRATYRKKYGDRPGAKSDLEFAYRSIPGANALPPVIGEYVGLLSGDGELAAAEQVLRTARTAAPADRQFSLMLVNVLFETRQPEKVKEAREIVREVSLALPDGDRQLLYLGDTLLEAGDRDAARSAAVRLAKVPANQPLASYLTGRLALLAGDWPTARAQLNAAIPALAQSPADRPVTAKAHLALAGVHASALDTAAQLKSALEAEKLATGATWIEAKLVVADALVRQDKRAEAIEQLRPITTKSRPARVLLARIRLANALADPTSADRWREFEVAVGTPPYPVELALMVVQSRVARNDPKALSDLEDELKKTPDSPELWLGLVALLADRDPHAARAALDKAAAALGDRADLRLARAALNARDPKPLDPVAVARLAADPDKKLSADDRFQVLRGVGDVLAARGFRTEALTLLKEASALRPFDLGVRLQVFDVANAANDGPACDAALDEIRRLDTATGPTARVAEVLRALATKPNPTPAEIAAWRESLTVAATARDGWARPHALLGDLAKLEKKSDAALAHYQAAIETGGAGDRVTQAAVELLLSQQNYSAAMRLMAQLDRSGAMSLALRRQYVLLRAASGEDSGSALQLVRSKEMTDSDNYRDHLLRSFVFKLHGQADEAKLALNKALATNDSAPEVWEMRVRHCLDVSPDDAAREVERAAAKLAQAPAADSLQVKLAVGHLRELVGQFDKAEAEYKAATELDRTDRRPIERLHDLYRRTRRGKEADALLQSFADKDGSVAKWARRQLAFARIEQPEGFSKIAEAVALIDRNSADGGESLDDVRAKAVVQAFDPLQRKESLATLTASLSRGPLTSVESVLYARLYLQGGQPEEAEKLLVAATSGGPRAAPVQLALLASVQSNRGELAAAKRTVDRLKLIDPFGWNTAVEAARLQAKTDKPAAAKTLLAHRAAEKPELRAYLIAPTLEALGCPEEAGRLHREWYETSTLKPRHVLLGEYLIRQKSADAAIALALKHADDLPPGRTARLLSGAVHSRHLDMLPAADREAWRKRVEEVTKWVLGKAEAAPTDADLLFAQAELADARGAYDEAIQFYGKAADRTVDRSLKAGLRNNRAWLMAVAQKDGGEEPMRLVNEAINARGPMPALLVTRAAVKLAGGQPEAALADLDAAVAADARPVYHFHRAVAFDRAKKPEARDVAVAEAVKRGLTRDALHPLHWPDYDRLVRK